MTSVVAAGTGRGLGSSTPDAGALAQSAVAHALSNAPVTTPAPLIDPGTANAVRPPTGLPVTLPNALLTPTDTSAVMSQMVQAMRVQVAQGGGQAEITLQPTYLGGVTLSIKVDDNGVSASLAADTPAVREALRAQEPALRQALGDQGLRLDRFEVSEPSETPKKNASGGHNAPPNEQQPPRQKRRDPAEPAFQFVA